MSEADALAFPPLLWGEEVSTDAFDHACQRALLGCDAGLVAHRINASVAQAALVFAPEVPLAKAMAMLPLCGVGFQNALGVMAPPEVAVHLDWDGGIRVNGAACGRFRAMASTATIPESPSTRRCLLTCGCRISSDSAISPTDRGPVRSNSTIRSRLGSASAPNTVACMGPR